MPVDNNAEQIIRDHADMIYRMAFAHVRDRSDADDVMQEVFLRYIRRRPVFESEEHCRRWFLRVTVNTAKNMNNSAWMSYVIPLELEIYEEPEENRLADALFRLPPKYRDVIHLHYLRDLCGCLAGLPGPCVDAHRRTPRPRQLEGQIPAERGAVISFFKIATNGNFLGSRVMWSVVHFSGAEKVSELLAPINPAPAGWSVLMCRFFVMSELILGKHNQSSHENTDFARF